MKYLYILKPDSDRFILGGVTYLYMSKRWTTGKGITNAKNLATGVRSYFNPHKTKVTLVDTYTQVRRTPSIVCKANDRVNVRSI